MPYDVRQDGPKDRPYCVYLESTGKKLGCSKTAEDARKFIAAIEAHKKEAAMVTKDYYDYVQLGQLSAYLASRLGYSVGTIDGSDPQYPVLCIDLPGEFGGQITFPMTKEYMATSFPEYDGSWDGHTDDDRRKRIQTFIGGVPDCAIPSFDTKEIESYNDTRSNDYVGVSAASTDDVVITGNIVADGNTEQQVELEENVLEAHEESVEIPVAGSNGGIMKKIVSFLEDLGNRIVEFTKEYNGPLDEEEEDEEEREDEETKETWDRAYINDLPDSAFLHIAPGGEKDSEGKTVPRSLRHLPYKDANGKVDLPHLRNAISRLGQSATGGGKDGWLSESLRKSLLARAQKLLGSSSKKTFYVTKQEDGQYRWVGISSTAFLDRDNEIVSRDALSKLTKKGEDYGPLVFWHTDYQNDSGAVSPLSIGTCDTQMVDGVTLIESGLWNDSPLAKAIMNDIISGNPQVSWGMSIGFYPLSSTPNVPVGNSVVKTVYDKIDVIERSVLPTEYASNPFTCIDSGGNNMDETKKNLLRKLIGDEQTDEIAARVDALNTKALDADAIVKEAEEPEATESKETETTDAAVVEETKEVVEESPVTENPPEEAKAETKSDDTAQVVKELASILAATLGKVSELQDQVSALTTATAPKGAIYRPSQSRENIVKSGDQKPVAKDTEVVAESIANQMISRLSGGS